MQLDPAVRLVEQSVVSMKLLLGEILENCNGLPPMLVITIGWAALDVPTF